MQRFFDGGVYSEVTRGPGGRKRVDPAQVGASLTLPPSSPAPARRSRGTWGPPRKKSPALRGTPAPDRSRAKQFFIAFVRIIKRISYVKRYELVGPTLPAAVYSAPLGPAQGISDHDETEWKIDKSILSHHHPKCIKVLKNMCQAEMKSSASLHILP